MNIALRKPRMTREEFAWAEAQDECYEFDGFEPVPINGGPVAMTGGTVLRSRLVRRLHDALGRRLAGTGCEPLGPDAGLATVGDKVRYPDALVTCGQVAGNARLVTDVRVVVEVLSSFSSRIEKLREYAAVPTILRYVIVEHTAPALTTFARQSGDAPWTANALTADEMPAVPELGLENPVAELYDGVDLAAPTRE